MITVLRPWLDVGAFNYLRIEIAFEIVKPCRINSASGCIYYLAHARVAHEQDIALPASRVT